MASSNSSQRVRFDRFELDLRTGELWRDAVPVDLPPQPARILAILVAEAGTLVGRSELRQRIWGESWLDWEASLHQGIRRIRVALDDSASAPRFVETLPRRGYRFVAAVEGAGCPALATPEPLRSAASPARAQSYSGRLVHLAGGSRRLFAVVLMVLVAILGLLGVVTGRSQRSEVASQAASPVASPVAPEALRLHREGLHFLSRGAVAQASDRFHRATVAAPDWAAPWSAIAEIELSRFEGDHVERARSAIESALARDPDDGRAWRLLGRLRLWEEWDWVGARGALGRAAQVEPEDAEVWQLLAALETVLGRESQALQAAHRAMELDPVSTGLRVDLGWTLYYFGRAEPALTECRRGLELDPESGSALQCVVQALLVLGRRQEAGALLAGAAEGSGAEPVAAYFERQLALLSGGESCASSAAAAIPKIVAGDREGALDALVAGVEERRGWEVPFARVDPLLAPLREQARFAQVERALGVATASR